MAARRSRTGRRSRRQELAGANSSFHDGHLSRDVLGLLRAGRHRAVARQDESAALSGLQGRAAFDQPERPSSSRAAAGISYVICWNGLVPAGESFYPVFKSVGIAAATHDWGNADHFPDYDMPSFPPPLILKPTEQIFRQDSEGWRAARLSFGKTWSGRGESNARP